jgi:hypothetical protein
MPPHSPARAATGLAAAPGIRRFTGPVRAHVLRDPTTYAALAALRCGDARSEAVVREVEQTAARLVAGTTTMAQTAVVLEDDSGALLGYASVHSRPPLGYEDRGPRAWIADRYIVAFGRDRAHRDHPLRDSRTRIGEVVVRAALDMIALEAPGRPMPSVSALVRPENEASHRLLEVLGFDNLPMAATGFAQDLRWRERGVPLPPALPRDVYVPPRVGALRPPPSRNDPCTCGSGRKWKKCCGSRARPG